MMKKGRAQNLAMLAAVAVLVYLLFTMNKKSAYSISEREYSAYGVALQAEIQSVPVVHTSTLYV